MYWSSGAFKTTYDMEYFPGQDFFINIILTQWSGKNLYKKTYSENIFRIVLCAV